MKMRARFALLLFIVLPAVMPVALAATDHVLMLNNALERLYLDNHVHYLEDPGATLELADIRQTMEPWTRNSGTFGRGRSGSAWWLKAVIHNPYDAPREWILEIAYPPLDQVDVYVISNGDVTAQHQLGSLYPFHQRLVDHVFYLVPIQWEAEQTQEIYIRLQSTSLINAPLTLWEPNALLSTDGKRLTFASTIVGALLLIGGYYFLLFVSLREPAHLYYACYVVTFAAQISNLSGGAFLHLWPDAPHWNLPAIALSTSLLVLFSNLFIRALLDIPRWSRPLGWLSALLIGAAALLPIGVFVLPYGTVIELILLTMIVSNICNIAIGLYAWYRDIHAARYYTLSWTLLFIGGMVYGIGHYGAFSTTFFVTYAVHFAVVAQLVLLALALGERMNLERRARIEAQDAALASMQQSNIELEARVRERTRALDRLNAQLRELSHTDPLTQLKNRRYLDETLASAWERSPHDSTSVAIALIDIDHFKPINDSHGHSVGDTCLREVAHRIRGTLQRPADEAIRYGGEEFFVLMPETTAAEAYLVADRIRREVAAKPIVHEELTIPITISIGVAATIPSADTTPAALLQAADAALYEAKRSGRNRVHVAPARQGQRDGAPQEAPLLPDPS